MSSKTITDGINISIAIKGDNSYNGQRLTVAFTSNWSQTENFKQ